MDNEQSPGRRMRSLRLSDTEIERAEALLGPMGDDMMVRCLGELSATKVMQLAVGEGLAVLEARYGVVTGAKVAA